MSNKFGIYLANDDDFVEVFSSRKKAEKWLHDLERHFKSNTDEIRFINVEKVIKDADFITVSGTAYKMFALEE